MSWNRGVVIGDFLPPHRGHHQLIDGALKQADRLVICVCERVSDPIPGPTRVAWLRERHPEADVRRFDCQPEGQTPTQWCQSFRSWFGQDPDALFVSSANGEALAARLGVPSVHVERILETADDSSDAIRRDPYRHWDQLEPAVCGWYAKRVVVLGAESTGTTTLARALAAALNTTWIVEYGRDYTQARDRTRGWAVDEFVRIAAEQNRRENLASRTANRILVCDTDAFATAIWNRRYLGSTHPEVGRLAAQRQADLYLLTGDEIRFVPDDIRDGEHIRHDMHGWFEQALAAQPVPWRLVRGSPQERLDRALQEIGTLFSDSAWKPRGPTTAPALA